MCKRSLLKSCADYTRVCWRGTDCVHLSFQHGNPTKPTHSSMAKHESDDYTRFSCDAAGGKYPPDCFAGSPWHRLALACRTCDTSAVPGRRGSHVATSKKDRLESNRTAALYPTRLLFGKWLDTYRLDRETQCTNCGAHFARMRSIDRNSRRTFEQANCCPFKHQYKNS